MKKYFLLILGLLMFTCSDDSSSTDPSGSNNNNNNNNNNNTPEIEITGQWDISETRSIADYFDKRKKNNIKSVVSTNNTLDVGIVSIDAPITGELTATETITITIGNFGTEEASNFDLIYSINYDDQGWQTDITETFSETIASEATAQYSFTTTADLSQLGQWSIAATTAMESDEDTENDVSETYVNSLNYSSICDVHSIIFEDDGSYSLYTNNEEGICNYVIFGTYDLDEEESTVTLYVEYDNTPIVLGTIEDVQVEDGEFSGTINFDDLCVQVVDGYEEDDYTEALTYIPDDNLEAYLIEIGVDFVMDDYITTSAAANVASVSPDAEDIWVEGGSIDFYDFDARFTDRLTNLAGIEALPNVIHINLRGHKLDCLNISQNSQLKNLYANFNEFYKLDTSGNPSLENFAIDNNSIIPELDFSQNNNLKSLAIPHIPAGGYIGDGGYISLSNLSQLEFLDIPYCNFDSIDLSNNTLLEEIRGQYNNFSSIEFSSNNINKALLCGNNISEIDVSSLESLVEFEICGNNLTSIDLSNNTQLEFLRINSNNLQGTLDVSMLENLVLFVAYNNPNLTCVKVNQTQLDNINNGVFGTDWALDSSVTISLDCN